MDKKELMKPRFEMVSDYPFSDSMVGDIFWSTSGGFDMFHTNMGVSFSGEILRKYSNIFKPIAWWHKREPKEFPGYLRVSSVNSDKVYKISKFNLTTGRAYSDGWKLILLKNAKPATFSEYNNFLNKIKHG